MLVDTYRQDPSGGCSAWHFVYFFSHECAHIHVRTNTIISNLLFLTLLMTSCGKQEVVTEWTVPIEVMSLASDADQVQSRVGSDPLNRDFVLYATKWNGMEEKVFNGYTIWYASGSAGTSSENSHDYSYVGSGQTIKYWDFGASSYHFWGVSADDPDTYSFSADGKTLTLPELQAGGLAPADNLFFSQLYERTPVSSDVVPLTFMRPHAMLRLQFYTNDTMTPGDEISLEQIKFCPDPEAEAPYVNSVYGQGTVTVTYPGASAECGSHRETIEVSELSSPQEGLEFRSAVLTSTQGISSNNAATALTTEGTEYYYLLPMGEKNPSFTLSLLMDGELMTSHVPAAYMHWQPNHSYTYLFKILEGGLIFVDAKAEAWKAGGSGSDTWTNW